jgi:hypothetical protein
MRDRLHTHRHAKRLLFAVAILLAAAVGLMKPGPAPAAEVAGALNIVRNATSEFDNYTGGATPSQQAWIRSHYSMIRGYAPYFDRALSWAPPAEVYKDLYAIYPEETSLISRHPEWLLREANGKPLYIPWECNGSSCTQYAGDVGNPEFRHWWIAEAQSEIAQGFEGLFIDDVNMEMRVGNAHGEEVAPYDPRTGAPMTLTNWRRYVAEFTEEIRAALPGVKITHNVIWYVDREDPSVRREMASANVVNLERGVNDSGLTAGGGKYGYESLLSLVEYVHAMGRSVMFSSGMANPKEREYEIASFLLVNNGADSLCAAYQADPDNWWSGYEMNLGGATSGRHRWNGLQRRDFADGMVLAAEPGVRSTTVQLGGTYQEVGGGTVSQVTLSAHEGVILIGADSAGAPASQPEVQEGTSVETPSPIEKPAEIKTPSTGGHHGGGSSSGPGGSSNGGSTGAEKPAAVEVSGQISTGDQGTVVIAVERHGANGWHKARKVKVHTDRRGHFKKRISGLGSGHYRVDGRIAGRRTRGRAVVRRHRRFSIG